MKLAIVFLGYLTIVPAFATNISISDNGQLCKLDFITATVMVNVDNESFVFHPSCKFRFQTVFKTKKNLKCTVQAGMCSVFFPQNKFEVSCSDGSRNSIGIECKEGQQGE